MHWLVRKENRSYVVIYPVSANFVADTIREKNADGTQWLKKVKPVQKAKPLTHHAEIYIKLLVDKIIAINCSFPV